jgi:ribonuclease P protein component
MVTAVDDYGGSGDATKVPPDRLWLGLVVPKRHARRSVTRNLFKRQIRAAVGRHASAMANGLWVVRLRAPFDKAAFTSAASTALRRAAHNELDGLLAGAIRRAGVR